ncbi:MAG: DNA/RNA non-specific endonuclease [Clostridia bacterium]|nr:DNA/RNA non-specific endonuclease [Clostridia bacterium]
MMKKLRLPLLILLIISLTLSLASCANGDLGGLTGDIGSIFDVIFGDHDYKGDAYPDETPGDDDGDGDTVKPDGGEGDKVQPDDGEKPTPEQPDIGGDNNDPEKPGDSTDPEKPTEGDGKEPEKPGEGSDPTPDQPGEGGTGSGTDTPTEDPIDPDPTPGQPEVEEDKTTEAIESYKPLDEIPEFVGDVFTVLNGNKPNFTAKDIVAEAYAYYSELDSLGRAGLAVGYLGRETLPTTDRKNPTYEPTGWVQAAYSGNVVTGGNIWNRSHLIAWSLAGDSGKLNLVTGTPFFNQLGMTAFETMVRDYIKETGNHVLYRVVPVFVGDELVCRGVTIEAYSIEDKGGSLTASESDGICFNVFIHNVNPGIIIDYATGRTELHPDFDTSDEEDDITYVVNIKSGNKIHVHSCSSVTQMKEENKLSFTVTLEEVIEYFKSKGKSYSFCGSCHPERDLAA